jgi:uncharacterized membrane protein (UPF0182 family)
MYQQAQEIRLYYQFNQVDVDRYHLPDGYHQVMLSARELSTELSEQARTWVNEKLQFTHGYGVAMSFVSKTMGGGFPQYVVDNIPPESAYGLKVDQPSIYYGETTPGYRIVATGIKEFDYPKGNQNVYTSYGGTGGIPLNSLWKRLLFTWTQADVNILFTSYPSTGKQDSTLEARSRACPADRSVLNSRQRPLRCGERRQIVLDPGCLHCLGSLPLFQSSRDCLRRRAELHS